jgi:hypothetical protein
MLIKRAASPGAVSFVQFEKDRNRSKLHGSNIINYRVFLTVTLYLMAVIPYIMREKISTQ